MMQVFSNFFRQSNNSFTKRYLMDCERLRTLVSEYEVDQICNGYFGEEAPLAKRKLLAGESILILGKGYISIQIANLDSEALA